MDLVAGTGRRRLQRAGPPRLAARPRARAERPAATRTASRWSIRRPAIPWCSTTAA